MAFRNTKEVKKPKAAKKAKKSSKWSEILGGDILAAGFFSHHWKLFALIMFLIIIYRSANDIYLAIFPCPLTAVHLQTIPQSAVQSCVLRTHVRQGKGLQHGLPAPFIVARRTHVAS